MTEFEQEVVDLVDYVKRHHDHLLPGYARRHAKVLMLIAINQFKDEIKKAIWDDIKEIFSDVISQLDNTRTERI